MRLKRRYVICQALSSDDLESNGDEYNARDLQKAIKDKVEALFGDIGAGQFGNLSVIHVFDPTSKIFVLRTSREAEISLRLAISCITSVKSKNLLLRTLSVSGSARTCLENLRTIFATLVDSTNTTEEIKAERRRYYESFTSNLELV